MAGVAAWQHSAQPRFAAPGLLPDASHPGTGEPVSMGIPQAAAARPRRRSDAGRVRLQQRDLDGLLLVADHYAAPYDLLAQALGSARPHAGRHRPVARSRVRRDRRPRPRPRVVLADPRRDGRVRPSLARPPAVAGATGACPGRPCRPALAAMQPGLGGRGRVVAVGTAHPRRPPAAPRRRRPRGRRRGALAVVPAWPARGPGLGRRGRADPQAVRTDGPDHGRAAGGPGYARIVYLVTPASRPVVTSTADALPDPQRGSRARPAPRRGHARGR